VTHEYQDVLVYDGVGGFSGYAKSAADTIRDRNAQTAELYRTLTN